MAITAASDNLSLAARMPDLELSEEDKLLFDFSNCDMDPELINDIRLALPSNGTSEDSLLQQLFEDSSTNAAASNRIQNSNNAFAYK